MKVKFESVVDGINRYLDNEIYKNLSDLQEFAARLVVGRINQNADSIKQVLMANGFVKTMSIIDSDGMVDIDSILQEVRREVERKGNIQVDVPLIGKITFCPADVDVLREQICGR